MSQMPTDTMQAQARKNMEAAQDQLLKNSATLQEQARRTSATMQEQLQQATGTTQELFRQNFAFAQDQWRQGLGIMQEQARQGAAIWQEQSQQLTERWRGANVAPVESAQQAQEALLDGVERLATQGAQVADNAFAATSESWQALFGLLSRNQEQAEQWLQEALAQQRIARDEATRQLRDLAEQTQRSQREFQQAVASSTRAALEAMRAAEQPQPATANDDQIAELHRKIDALTAQVEALAAAKIAPVTRATAKA